MKKTLLQKSLALLSAIALLIVAGFQFVSAEPISDTVKPLDLSFDVMPANIRALTEDTHQADGDIIFPGETPFELRTFHPDGTSTLEIFAVPVRYKDANGDWQYIDTSMKSAGTFEKYDYENAANAFSVKYSKDATKGIQMADAFTLSVPNAPSGLFAAKATVGIDENSDGLLTYPQAFGANTYLEYINISRGFKENIVLEQNVGINRFDFKWQSNTHTPVLSEDKSFIQIVRNDDPEEVEYQMLPLYVYDSYKPDMKVVAQEPATNPLTDMSNVASDAVQTIVSVEETTTAPFIQNEEQELPSNPGFKHSTEDCHYEIVKHVDGSYTISIVVSEEFLNHPETVYPVVIDPSVIASQTVSNILDTWVNAASGYTNTNYCNDTRLRFGYYNYSTTAKHKMFTYVKFQTLPNVPGTIINASLRVNFVSGTSTSHKGVMARLYNTWTSSTLTWNKVVSDSVYGTSPATYSEPYSLSYYEFDATALVKGWYNNTYPNYGVNITYSPETWSDYNVLYSVEGSTANAPKLTINYSTGAVSTSYPSSTATYTSSTFKWPVTKNYTISDYFGCTRSCHSNHPHNGTDIASSGSNIITNTPIMAAADGLIMFAGAGTGDFASYGNYVVVLHSINNELYWTLYAHMSSVSVTSGKSINKGQQVGLVGSTGNVTGPHLHFEVGRGTTLYSNRTNPMNYFS